MRVLLTVDVEAHRLVDEIAGPKRDGLGRILSLFDAHRVRGTFFIDVCGADTWGEDVIRGAGDRILANGHDLQLHVHPHHCTRDSSRWLLSEYSYEEQQLILGKAVERYRQYFGKEPQSFRAGGFGLDDHTIDLVRSAGIEVDCSFMWGRAGCNITPFARGVPSIYRGIKELPMTPVIDLGTRRWPLRIGTLDFNWHPLFVLEDALATLRAASAPVAVLLLHSSSMYVRIGERHLLYRVAHERKLSRLLDFLTAGGFSVLPVTEATGQLKWHTDLPVDDVAYVARGIPVQYTVLLFQSLVGAGISATFQAFIIGHLAVAALLVGAILWLVRK